MKFIWKFQKNKILIINSKSRSKIIINLPQDEVSQYPEAHVHLLLVELQVSPTPAVHMYVALHAIP